MEGHTERHLVGHIWDYFGFTLTLGTTGGHIGGAYRRVNPPISGQVVRMRTASGATE